MELRHLRYFVMAAEERNISRAAARLNISQPAVSRQIKDLEDEFGAALFERGGSGLELTEAGEFALPHARDLLRRAGDLSTAMESLNRPSLRSLKVGFIPTALSGFLAKGLRKFNREHKDVCTQIREMSPMEQEKALRDGEIDLALLGTACPQLLEEYNVESILKTPMAIVLPDDHLLALRDSIDLAELGDDSFVSLHEKNFPGRPALLADLFGRAGINPEVSLKAEGLQEMLGLVAGGAGVGVLPEDVNQLPHPGVVFVQMRNPQMELVSSAVWRKSGDNADVEDLVETLREVTGNTKKK